MQPSQQSSGRAGPVALTTQAGEQPLWTFDRGRAKVSGAHLLAK